MLRSLQDLESCAIHASDGDIGRVKDFFFDDRAWVIRYLVIETGSWLSSRKVLISPMAIRDADWDGGRLSVSVTKEQVRNSPDVDTEQPVSRQHEMRYLGYYGYPYYWGGSGLWGTGLFPSMMMTGIGGPTTMDQDAALESRRNQLRREATQHQDDDPHLRSAKAVMDYHIHAKDGEIVHVQGILLDERTWAVRYLVVNTRNWWMGHQVLVAPQWIESVSYIDATVAVNLTRKSVQEAPLFDSTATLNREQEQQIYGHYGRTGYWTNEMLSEPDKHSAIDID